MFGHKVLPALVFCCALVLSFGFVSLVHDRETLRQTRQVDLIFSEAVTRLEYRMRQAMTTLASTSAFISSRESRFMSQGRFSKYVDELHRHRLLDGIHSIGLVERISPAQQADVLAQLTKDHGLLSPDLAKDRTIAPVLLYRSLHDEASLAGMDVLPAHAQALDQAYESNDFSISAPSHDAKGQGEDTYVSWIYLITPHATPNAAQRFVFLQVRLDEVIASISLEGEPPLGLRISDETQVLYTSPSFSSEETGQRLVHELTLGGRSWQIEGKSHLVPDHFLISPATKITALVCLVSAFALTFMTRSILLDRRSQRFVMEAQYANLKAQDMHLREMSHRLKNVLTRVIAIARQTARSTQDKGDFLSTLDSRLRAMAQAQDMLMLSAREAVDMRRLIEAEVRQIYSESVSEFQMTGERIVLSPDQIQPLGLAIHELATNALKYGAAAQPDGRLDIEWRLIEGLDKPLIQLEWHESFPPRPMPPKGRNGFGTHLIDTCIKSDLGGQITRTLHETGLEVSIQLPFLKEDAKRRGINRKHPPRKT